MNAFPTIRRMTFKGIDGDEIEKEVGSEGMDLRDYFAAQAIGNIPYPSPLNEYNTEHFKQYMEKACACAYQIADEMMKAKEK